MKAEQLYPGKCVKAGETDSVSHLINKCITFLLENELRQRRKVECVRRL